MKQLSRIGHTFFIDPDEIPYICLHTFIHYIHYHPCPNTSWNGTIPLGTSSTDQERSNLGILGHFWSQMTLTQNIKIMVCRCLSNVYIQLMSFPRNLISDWSVANQSGICFSFSLFFSFGIKFSFHNFVFSDPPLTTRFEILLLNK